MIKGNIAPKDGGCWYCHKNDGILYSCWEFDTYIHLECILERKKEIEKNNEYDPEWEIIAKEML
jgi:hypothetical protein